MSIPGNPLAQFSQALAAHATQAAQIVAAVRLSSHRHLSGVLWQADTLAVSEQSLPKAQKFEAVLPDGKVVEAKVAGRDPSTNVAALQLSDSAPASFARATQLQVGELVFAYGSDGSGGTRARMGVVNAVGPQWHSQAGGRIDARVVVDIRLSASEEGGPVLNAAGELLGMSTFGNRNSVLVIPVATLDRVIPVLLREGSVARGWLGLALQPVVVPNALRDLAGQSGGAMVMSVAENGPGAQAAILPGDIVLTIEGVPAIRMDKVIAQLDTDSVGRNAEVRLIRGGAITTLQVLISARPAA